MESRVYKEKININTEKTRAFYDQRARTIENRKQKYTTVLLGDQDPLYASRWDEYEKTFIMPKLHITQNTNVLDLGCGMGRWADSLDGECQVYCGVDFSAEMIKAAQNKKRGGDFRFYNMSVKDALSDQNILKNKYDVVIMTGVSMYINDRELAECYALFKNAVNDGALIYFEESVGKTQRLTLNQIWSENLGAYYGAIYRTRKEYMELLKSQIRSIEFVEEGYMDVLDKEEQSETSHWYALFHL